MEVDLGLIANQILWGVLVGISYSLLAMAFSLIYSTSGAINFAAGEFAMLGAYFCYTFMSTLQGGIVLSALLALVAISLFGMLVERIAFRRLYRLDPMLVLIATIGISIIIKNGVLAIWGPFSQSFPQILPADPIILGSLIIIPQNIILLVIGIVVMIAFHLFMTRTSLGTAMRATAENRRGADLVGIDTTKCINYSWGLGSALAGVAGLMLGFAYNLTVDMGTVSGIKGFTSAIIGGFGNLPASTAGGIVLGVVENMSALVASYYYKDVIAFALIIVILLVRPRGLFVKAGGFRKI